MLTGRREAPLQETAGLIAAAGGLPALVAPADLTDAAAVDHQPGRVRSDLFPCRGSDHSLGSTAGSTLRQLCSS